MPVELIQLICYPSDPVGGGVMSNMDDLPKYYRHREKQEREAAELAQSEEVRRIHLTLADKYQSLADKEEKRI